MAECCEGCYVDCSTCWQICACHNKYHFRRLMLLAYCILTGILSISAWCYIAFYLHSNESSQLCTAYLTCYGLLQLLTFVLIHFDEECSDCEIHQAPSSLLHFLTVIGAAPAICFAIAFMRYRHKNDSYLKGFIKSCYASLILMPIFTILFKHGFAWFWPPSSSFWFWKFW